MSAPPWEDQGPSGAIRSGPRTRRPVTPWRKAWRGIEHWIVLIHRWIGIATCLICTVWCLSGIALIYVVQPKVMDQEYRAGLNPILWSQVHIGPTAALEAAGLAAFPQRARLEMSGGRPVYSFTDWSGAQVAVGADDGQRIAHVDAARAMAIARGWAHTNRPTYLKPVSFDRWVYKPAFDTLRPFHLIALHDDLDRQIYVSARTGAVAMDTSAHDRFWSWLARVPHLLELPIERSQAGPWRQFFLWSTALAAVVAVGGLVLGFVRLSLIKRYGEGRISPFKGFMLWHHLLGLIGGITLFTWVGTAFIYMHPGHWLDASAQPTAAMQRYAHHQAANFPLTAERLGQIAPPGAVYAGFSWLAGKPLAYFGFKDLHIQTYDGETGALSPLSGRRLTEAAKLIVPQAAVVQAQLRTEPDRYWHSFKGDVRKTPMFRVEFADPKGTWLHLDPDTGELLQTKTAADRTYFLFFNEIHKFDFYSMRGLAHDILVWILVLMGAGISITGVVVGWKHLSKPSGKAR
ncbi:MAG TPA: PepSY domain-containing protein [Caulobacteraceae bacterium]|nr:PepSY domain-containing protein [Caulobacteraceae bacterium]